MFFFVFVFNVEINDWKLKNYVDIDINNVKNVRICVMWFVEEGRKVKSVGYFLNGFNK